MSNKTHNLIHIEMGAKKRTKKLKPNRCLRNAPYNAPLKVDNDPSVVLSQDQLQELELIHQDKLHAYQQYVANFSLPRVSEQILESSRSIDSSKQYYWITWTYDKKYAYCEYETRRDVALIRRKLSGYSSRMISQLATKDQRECPRCSSLLKSIMMDNFIFIY